MPKRIFHMALDEKFVNSANTQFEELYPGRNEFLIFSGVENPKLMHVEPRKNVVKTTSREVLQNVLPRLAKGDIVVFHSLAGPFYGIANALPNNVTAVWFCYGYEVYGDPYFFSERLLQDRITAKKFPVAGMSRRARFTEFLTPYYRLINPKIAPTWIEAKKAAMKRMDYLASSFDEEFEAIQNLIGFRKKKFQFWCYSIESMVDMASETSVGRNILIGNSGHISGNHLDVFEKIRTFKTDSEIVVPLSYGNQEYINEVIDSGKQIFGQRFRPLTEFYALDQYNQILSGCGIAILNARRQQAVNSTIALLWLGSKVFLSEKNTFFKYLKRLGVIVFSYENDLTQENLTLLSADEIARNRTILFENLNREKLKKELKESIDQIDSND